MHAHAHVLISLALSVKLLKDQGSPNVQSLHPPPSHLICALSSFGAALKWIAGMDEFVESAKRVKFAKKNITYIGEHKLSFNKLD